MARHEKTFKLRRWAPLQMVLYGALRGILILVSLLGYRRALAVGRLLGALLHAVDFKHRTIALKNVVRSDLQIADPERFVRRVYDHLGTSLAELLFLIPRLGREQGRHVVSDAPERIRTILRRGKGGIFVIAHLGNWELVGIALMQKDLPLSAVARPIENPWIDRYVNRRRSSTGVRIISKYGALRNVGESLRSGGAVVLLADQNARKSGTFVPFLGREASTVKSPALMALKYDAPVYPVNVYRDGDGRHRCILGDPILPADHRNAVDPVRSLSAAVTRQLEGFIRQHPEQWMWLHARWKTRPEDVGRGRRFTSQDYAHVEEE
jgi:KDO2-lipid IV(A) lauroyltransferase